MNRSVKIAIMTLVAVSCIGAGFHSAASNEKDKNIEKKVDIILQKATEDISKSFNEDKRLKNYTKYSCSEAVALSQEVAAALDELSYYPALGSTEPSYYVSPQKDEVIMTYKTDDGTNVLLSSKKNGVKWEISKEAKKGVPILTLQEAEKIVQ